jgi:APA family basic amino acid/polyamine antiporter
MALTFAAHAAPDDWERPVAVTAVAALAAVNYRGKTCTARLARIIVALVLAALAVVVAASLIGGQRGASHLTTWTPATAIGTAFRSPWACSSSTAQATRG